MRFYTSQHQFYCGIDLHARTMHLCILDHDGNVVFDQQPRLPARRLPARRRSLSRRPRRRRRMYVRLVLARRSVRGHEDPLRARPRPVHESHPRRQGQERQASTPTRSPACFAAALSRSPTPIPKACAKPATCSAGARTSSTNAPNSSPTCRSSTASTTCRHFPRS